MTFWSTFGATFLALLSWSICMELYQVGMQYWLYRRQEKRMNDLQTKINTALERGEPLPEEVLSAIMPLGGNGAQYYPTNGKSLPTASGTYQQTGQYL